jgi:Uma2 family endonuclease
MVVTRSTGKSERGIRLLTVADLAVLPAQLPSGPILYELDNGELVTFPVHDGDHGAVKANFAAALMVQGQQRGRGKARCGGVGVILWRTPDRVIGADVLFVASRSLPIRVSPEDYLETLPDPLVEVRGRADSDSNIRRKVADCLTAGVAVVWRADPRKKTVTEHRRGKKPRIFTAKDTLTIEDVIPGFQMPVTEVFQL